MYNPSMINPSLSNQGEGARRGSGGPSVLPIPYEEFRKLPEIKLATTREEKQLFDQLGDLYSIIVATEHLEKAYVRDAVTTEAYTEACKKLIAQYKTLKEALGEQAEVMVFNMKYSLNCNAAANRFKVGVPATTFHGGHQNSGEEKKREIHVFHAVQHFITAMDSLKLSMKCVDELHPSFSDLLDSLNKVPDLPPDHVSKVKVQQWLLTLNTMKASDELPEDKIRQMSMDLEIAYAGFHKFVSGN